MSEEKGPYTITQAVLEQRRQAARTHGAYAIQARGIDATTPEQRAAWLTYRDDYQTVDGLIDGLIDGAVRLRVMCEAMEAEIAKARNAGKKTHQIPAIRAYRGFRAEHRRHAAVLIAHKSEATGYAADIINAELSKNDDT